MSNDVSEGALAAEKATEEDVLELHALSVIGVIEGHNGAAALLRSSRGEIAKVSPGDSAFGVRVAAIGPDQVLLTNWLGQTTAYPVTGG